MQESRRRAFTPASAHRQLVAADAIGRLSVKILIGRQTVGACRIQPVIAGIVLVLEVRYVQRSLPASILRRGAVVGFDRPEIRENILIRPSLGTQRLPSVEVLMLSPDICLLYTSDAADE